MRALNLRFDSVKKDSITVDILADILKQLTDGSIYDEGHNNFWCKPYAKCAYIRYDEPKKGMSLVDGDIYCPVPEEAIEYVFEHFKQNLTFPDGGYVYPIYYDFIEEATLITDGYHRLLEK